MSGELSDVSEHLARPWTLVTPPFSHHLGHRGNSLHSLPPGVHEHPVQVEEAHVVQHPAALPALHGPGAS